MPLSWPHPHPHHDLLWRIDWGKGANYQGFLWKLHSFPTACLVPPPSNTHHLPQLPRRRLGSHRHSPGCQLSTAQGGSSLSCLSKFRSFRLKSKLSTPAALRLQNRFFHNSYVRGLGPLSLPYPSPSPPHPWESALYPFTVCLRLPHVRDPTPSLPEPQTQTS